MSLSAVQKPDIQCIQKPDTMQAALQWGRSIAAAEMWEPPNTEMRMLLASMGPGRQQQLCVDLL